MGHCDNFRAGPGEMETHIDVKSNFSRHTTILKYLLYWPIEQKNRNYFVVFIYKFLSLIKISATVVLYVFLQVLNVYENRGDAAIMIESTLTVFTNLNYLVKLFSCVYYNKEIVAILEEMTDKRFQPDNLRRKNMILKVISNWKNMFRFYMGMCVSITSTWSILPLIKNRGATLPFNYWYPFDVSVSPVHEMIFAYEYFGMLMIAVSHVTLDALMAGILAFISAQIEVLNDILFNLNYVKIENESMDNHAVLMDQIDCISLHRKIRRIVQKINKILAIPMFVQATLGALILCLALYKLSKVPIFSGEGVSHVNYYIAMLFQLSIYFWYGNEILWKSDELSKSAYQCDWVNTNKCFKKNLLFFMMSTKQPLKIRGGPYIILSLDPLIAIIKFSWSCYTLLKSV